MASLTEIMEAPLAGDPTSSLSAKILSAVTPAELIALRETLAKISAAVGESCSDPLAQIAGALVGFKATTEQEPDEAVTAIMDAAVDRLAASQGVVLPEEDQGTNAIGQYVNTSSLTIDPSADVPDEGWQAGFNLTDLETAAHRVLDWLSGRKEYVLLQKPAPWKASSLEPQIDISLEPSTVSYVITKHYAAEDGSELDLVSALLSGTSKIHHYHYTEGVVEWLITPEDLEKYRATYKPVRSHINGPAHYAKKGASLSKANILSTNFRHGLGSGNTSWMQQFGSDEDSPNPYAKRALPWDAADHLPGVSYQEIQEQRERDEFRRNQMIQNAAEIASSNLRRNALILRTWSQPVGPNPLTGVPDASEPEDKSVIRVNPEVVQDVVSIVGKTRADEILKEFIIEAGGDEEAAAHGLALMAHDRSADLTNDDLRSQLADAVGQMNAASAPRMSDVYVPAQAPHEGMTLQELLAECLRTRQFAFEHVHPIDSSLAYSLTEVLDLYWSNQVLTPADELEMKRWMIAALTRVHEVLAVPVALNAPIQTVNLPAAQQSAGTANNLIITSTASTNFTVLPGSNGMVGWNNNLQGYVQAPGYSSPARAAIRAFEGKAEDAFDRSFKLIPNHRYLLPDGGVIEVDAVGNYTVRDEDAQITYLGSRMRDFNPFISASDRVAEFIEMLGTLGATQRQAAHAPIEMFVRWLILKAAEKDGETMPDDVPPISTAEVQVLAEQLTEAS